MCLFAAACVGQASDPAGGSAVAALEGPYATAECPTDVDDFVHASMTLGRAIVETPEFAACVRGLYVPCFGDSIPNVEALLAVTKSANATKMACRTDPPAPDAVGWTQGDDVHSYLYDDVEEIKLNQEVFQSYESQWASGSSSDTQGPGFAGAGIIWHEAMHVHRYLHGDNDDSGTAKCGYDGVSAVWNVNSGPYAVQRCVLSVGTSFVKNAMAAAHKRYSASLASTLYNGMAMGTTAEQVRSLAAGNGLRAQAAPITVGTTVRDELYDALDTDWYVVTIPRALPVDLALTTTDGSAAPKVTLETASGTILPPTSTSTSGTGESVVTSWSWLVPGTYYVHVSDGSIGTRSKPFTLLFAEPTLAAPTGCSGTVVCGSYIDFTCASDRFFPFVQHSLDGGATWDNDASMSVPFRLDSTFHWAQYRVCNHAYFGTTIACTPVSSEELGAACDAPPPPGGGPSPGAGGKRCSGRLCRTSD